MKSKFVSVTYLNNRMVSTCSRIRNMRVCQERMTNEKQRTLDTKWQNMIGFMYWGKFSYISCEIKDMDKTGFSLFKPVFLNVLHFMI